MEKWISYVHLYVGTGWVCGGQTVSVGVPKMENSASWVAVLSRSTYVHMNVCSWVLPEMDKLTVGKNDSTNLSWISTTTFLLNI
jgi:hypothetical protein